jgi:membrane-associated protein
MSIVDQLLHPDLVSLVQFIGYPGLAAVIFAESGIPFGFFLPGASMIFTAGLLASRGLFNIWVLLPLVVFAAILGDNVGYWIGAKFGIKLFAREDSRFFHRRHLARAEHFYERHGARTIFLARFVPIVRTFAPIVAGIAGMRYRTFFLYNLLGAIVWAGGSAFLGATVGHLRFVSEHFGLIILGIIVVTTLPVLAHLGTHDEEDATK